MGNGPLTLKDKDIMWAIELSYRYNSIVSRLIFDTEEQAKAERDKLLPFIGKDRFELAKNESPKAITLIDKAGTIDVDATEVKSMRCYNVELWNNAVIPFEAKYKVMAAKERAKAQVKDTE